MGINTNSFELLDEVKATLDKIIKNNKNDEIWQQKINYYKENYPKDYECLSKIIKSEITQLKPTQKFVNKDNESTRNLSSAVLNKFFDINENILCGNADLSSCTKAIVKNSSNFTQNNFTGRNLLYGVREL